MGQNGTIHHLHAQATAGKVGLLQRQTKNSTENRRQEKKLSLPEGATENLGPDPISSSHTSYRVRCRVCGERSGDDRQGGEGSGDDVATVSIPNVPELPEVLAAWTVLIVRRWLDTYNTR